MTREPEALAGVGDLLAAHQAFGRVHGDGADGVLAKMLGSVSPVIKGAELASPQPVRSCSSVMQTSSVCAWVSVSPAILMGCDMGTSSGKSWMRLINMWAGAIC